jgi:hypothetical protein
MNRTAFFTLPFYPMPDKSKAALKPGRSWFEINPTCSPVYITEGPGLIFHKYNSDADARLHRVQLRTVLEMNTGSSTYLMGKTIIVAKRHRKLARHDVPGKEFPKNKAS